jgi:hypothetical protein
VAALDKLKPKAKPDPTQLYEAIEGFASGNTVFQRGYKVRGDHPAVIAHRALFMPANLDELEKEAVRREYWGASYRQMDADTPKPPPPPRATRPTGGMRAVANYTVQEPELGGPRVLSAGTVVDASDPLYRAFPHLFQPYVEER